MRPTGKWIIACLLAGCLIFAFSPGPTYLIARPTGFEFREQLVNLTGVCALSLMVLAMVASLRLERVNRLMGGLDKAYAVHKWAGIYTLVFGGLHWAIEKVPHLLVYLNLVRHPGLLGDESQYSDVEIILFKSGTVLAEWSFYLLVPLIIVALLDRIPYRLFRYLHKTFPVLFLAFAYHAATAQIKGLWYGSPAGYLLLLILVPGCFAAVTALLQRIGQSRKRKAEVESIELHRDDTLDIRLRIPDRPFLYKPGQYAFLQFPHDSEPHPFTIASSGNPSSLRFVIKGLGDFTKSLADHVEVGQPVTIEGPYGEFKFEDSSNRHVWIAGGIGITPFMARLEHLSNNGDENRPVGLWYCTHGSLDNQLPADLQDLCAENGIKLHHLDSMQNQFLTADMLKAKIENFSDLSIWFCGPKDFANSLLHQLKAHGFDGAKFHYDDFSMR